MVAVAGKLRAHVLMRGAAFLWASDQPDPFVGAT